MATRRKDFVIQIHQLTDALLIAIVFWLAHAFRESLPDTYPHGISIIGFSWEFVRIHPFDDYKWLYLIIIPLCPFVLDVNGYYDRPRALRWGQTLWIIIKSVTLCGLLVIAAMYFLELTKLSRGVIGFFAVFSIVVLGAKEILTQIWIRQRAARGANAREIILVGAAARNEEFERLLREHPEWNARVIARLDPDAESLAQLPDMLHQHPVEWVIFNVTQTSFSEVEKAILACEIEGVEAWLVADFVRTSVARAAVEEFHGKPVLVFRTTPDISWQLVGKRLVDIMGAGLGLLILGPLVMLPIAIAIKLGSPGPVLFRQQRSGLRGRLFTMYKFRSMVDNAEMLRVELEVFNEMSGPVFKMKEDPRLTKVGRFIRKTSIDELPQLWNVLLGDMSLVGPRPPIPSEVEKYDPWHRRRLSMRPGLTCLWQISGRNNIGFEQWMKLDLQYIDNWSLWLDLKILLRTIPVVVSGFGAR